MTPKEKAHELIDNMLYCYQGHIDEYTAKQCALVAVNEVIEVASWGGIIDNELEINSKEY